MIKMGIENEITQHMYQEELLHVYQLIFSAHYPLCVVLTIHAASLFNLKCLGTLWANEIISWGRNKHSKEKRGASREEAQEKNRELPRL